MYTLLATGRTSKLPRRVYGGMRVAPGFRQAPLLSSCLCRNHVAVPLDRIFMPPFNADRWTPSPSLRKCPPSGLKRSHQLGDPESGVEVFDEVEVFLAPGSKSRPVLLAVLATRWDFDFRSSNRRIEIYRKKASLVLAFWLPSDLPSLMVAWWTELIIGKLVFEPESREESEVPSRTIFLAPSFSRARSFLTFLLDCLA